MMNDILWLMEKQGLWEKDKSTGNNRHDLGQITLGVLVSLHM